MALKCPICGNEYEYDNVNIDRGLFGLTLHCNRCGTQLEVEITQTTLNVACLSRDQGPVFYGAWFRLKHIHKHTVVSEGK